MRKISAVGLFCCDKFEETPKQKVINLSKLQKFYFSPIMQLVVWLLYSLFIYEIFLKWFWGTLFEKLFFNVNFCL